MHKNDECGVRVSRTAARDVAHSTASPGACLGRARHRARLRRDLERLDTRMLHDIGVRREDLVREACRPFWRA